VLFSPAPKDTIAYWLKGHALGAHLDRRAHKAVDAAQALQKLSWFGTMHAPDQEAVSFYLLNHVVAEISAKYDPMEPLPSADLQLVQRYVTRGSEIAARLFYYVFLITAREARHNQSSYEASKIVPAMKEDYPDMPDSLISSMFSFLKGFNDSSSGALAQMLQVNSQWELGPLCKLMSVVYYKCKWGSAFGGKKWGNIADCLYRLVTSEWSAEMFADTAFTLAHNTAPIFNKGMLYNSPGAGFIKLLDCQRAGVIPQYLAENPSMTGIADDVQYVKLLKPNLISGKVDWQMVKNLGAVGDHVPKAKKTAAPYGGSSKPKDATGAVIQVDVNHTLYVLKHEREAA
jgi:hypothetical protein